MAEWLASEEITIYHSPATLFRHFATTLTDSDHFPQLRLIHLANEPVFSSDIALYKKHFHNSCLPVSSYGTTEALTFRFYFIDHHTPVVGNTVPVGYPVEDREVLILSEDGEKVTPGQVGEIAVKSRHLSPAYWRKPSLTKAAFAPEKEEEKERIYFTGDLGVVRSDGFLVHIGRKDFSVQIRGHRVEFAEVEAALLSHTGTREAVVMGRRDRFHPNA